MPSNFDNFLKDIWETTRPSIVRTSTLLNESYFNQNASSKLLALILANQNSQIQSSTSRPNTRFYSNITKNEASSGFYKNQISNGIKEAYLKDRFFAEDYMVLKNFFLCYFFYQFQLSVKCCKFFFIGKKSVFEG